MFLLYNDGRKKKIKEENLNKIEKKRCEDFLKDKNCELCEQIFDDLLNKTGFYNLVKNPPELVSKEDIDELGYDKAVSITRDDFIKPAEALARCKVLCRKHQIIIRRDNHERMEKKLEIPEDFSLLRIKKSLI